MLLEKMGFILRDRATIIRDDSEIFNPTLAPPFALTYLARAMTDKRASWRSGYAADCKSVHPGSIPGEASKSLMG